MKKEKISLTGRIVHLFTHHPLLKMIALFLAIVVWLYVNGEIGRY